MHGWMHGGAGREQQRELGTPGEVLHTPSDHVHLLTGTAATVAAIRAAISRARRMFQAPVSVKPLVVRQGSKATWRALVGLALHSCIV